MIRARQASEMVKQRHVTKVRRGSVSFDRGQVLGEPN
jgi:hypothetical protein